MSRVIALLLTAVIVCGCTFTGSLMGSPPSSGIPGVSGRPAATAPGSPTASTVASPAPTPVRTPRPTTRPSPAPTARGGIQTLAVGMRDTTPTVSAADLRTVVAFDLYQRLRKTETGNIVFGPYSISVAFAMQDAGALNRTARQIEQVLHYTLPTARLDAAFNELSLALASRANKRVTISIANRLFGQQGFKFRNAYLREITRSFAAPMAAMDFVGAPEAARKLINKWVAAQTAQRIKELLPKGEVTRDTRLVLVNAMYLNARWANQFLRNSTSDERFYLLGGDRVKVPTMHELETLPVAVTPDYTAVELPYVGGKLAMLVVMPKAGSFTRFERSMDTAALNKVAGALHKHLVDLALPTFSSRSTLPLADVLMAMGMKDAFDKDLADLYGISGYPRSDPGRLYISAVFHQALIKVAEKGTEAAAATAIVDSGTTGGSDVPIVQATIDHPFLWFIRDRVTGTILFMGRVLDPSEVAR
jgi:serpin B